MSPCLNSEDSTVLIVYNLDYDNTGIWQVPVSGMLHIVALSVAACC